MEAMKIGFCFMGCDWTFSVKNEKGFKFPLMMECYDEKAISLCLDFESCKDQDYLKKAKSGLATSLMTIALRNKFGRYTLIDKNGNKSEKDGKPDFEDVLDADLVHVLAENNDEIQGVLENLYEETLKSVN